MDLSWTLKLHNVVFRLTHTQASALPKTTKWISSACTESCLLRIADLVFDEEAGGMLTGALRLNRAAIVYGPPKHRYNFLSTFSSELVNEVHCDAVVPNGWLNPKLIAVLASLMNRSAYSNPLRHKSKREYTRLWLGKDIFGTSYDPAIAKAEAVVSIAQQTWKPT